MHRHKDTHRENGAFWHQDMVSKANESKNYVLVLLYFSTSSLKLETLSEMSHQK